MDNTHNILVTIGKNIKQRRKDLGITQSELSKKCGFSDNSSISKIEKGLIDIPSTTISKISNALGISPSQLLGYKPLPVIHTFDEIAMTVREEQGKPSFIDELTRLTKLYKDGMLTKKEFSLAKERLLK